MTQDEAKNYVAVQLYSNNQNEIEAKNVRNSVNKSIDYTKEIEDKVATIGSKVGGIDADKETGVLYISDKSGNVIGKFDNSGLSVTDVKVLKEGNLQSIFLLLSAKVDAVSGKSLSTNDYTNAEKTKVATIENKVDKEQGKVLSSNDFTDTLKTKLENVKNIECIDESNKDTLYITDSDGNIIGKFDKDGLSTVDVNLIEGDKKIGLKNLLSMQSNNEDDGFYIADKKGNVVFKVDEEGVDFVGKNDNNVEKFDTGETRTDIVYNIMYGRSLSYHGWIANGANMHTCLQFDSNDNNYMLLGITEDMIDDDTALDAFFKGLKKSRTNISGTEIAHANKMFMELLRDENGIDIKFDENGNPNYYFQLLGCNPGVVAESNVLMNPSSLPYKRILKSVQYAKKFAEAEGKTFSVGAVCYMESEEYNTYKQRYDKLWAFASNIDHDIRAITGQENPVYTMSYQMGSPADSHNFGVGIPLAQLQIAMDEGTDASYELTASGTFLQDGVSLIDRKYLVMGAIMNPLNYANDSDHLHASAKSYVMAGAQWGVQLKRTLYDCNPIVPIHVKSHSVKQRADGKYLTILNFHAPVRPLVFDTSNEECYAQRATSANKGFQLKDASGNEMIEAVYLRRGQEIVIVTSANPTGKVLYYAKDGWENGGNLRDSQDIKYNMGETDYYVYNWCPTFKLTI